MADDFTDAELDALLLEIRHHTERMRQRTDLILQRQRQWEVTRFNSLADQIAAIFYPWEPVTVLPSSPVTLHEPNKFEVIDAAETVVVEEAIKAAFEDDIDGPNKDGADEPKRDDCKATDEAINDYLNSDGVKLDALAASESIDGSEFVTFFVTTTADQISLVDSPISITTDALLASINGIVEESRYYFSTIGSLNLVQVLQLVFYTRLVYDPGPCIDSQFSSPISRIVLAKMHSLCFICCSRDLSGWFTKIIVVCLGLLKMPSMIPTVFDSGAARNVWCLNFPIILECSLPMVIAATKAKMMKSYSDCSLYYDNELHYMMSMKHMPTMRIRYSFLGIPCKSTSFRDYNVFKRLTDLIHIYVHSILELPSVEFSTLFHYDCGLKLIMLIEVDPGQVKSGCLNFVVDIYKLILVLASYCIDPDPSKLVFDPGDITRYESLKSTAVIYHVLAILYDDPDIHVQRDLFSCLPLMNGRGGCSNEIAEYFNLLGWDGSLPCDHISIILTDRLIYALPIIYILIDMSCQYGPPVYTDINTLEGNFWAELYVRNSTSGIMKYVSHSCAKGLIDTLAEGCCLMVTMHAINTVLWLKQQCSQYGLYPVESLFFIQLTEYYPIKIGFLLLLAVCSHIGSYWSPNFRMLGIFTCSLLPTFSDGILNNYLTKTSPTFTVKSDLSSSRHWVTLLKGCYEITISWFSFILFGWNGLDPPCKANSGCFSCYFYF